MHKLFLAAVLYCLPLGNISYPLFLYLITLNLSVLSGRKLENALMLDLMSFTFISFVTWVSTTCALLINLSLSNRIKVPFSLSKAPLILFLLISPSYPLFATLFPLIWQMKHPFLKYMCPIPNLRSKSKKGLAFGYLVLAYSYSMLLSA